MNWSYVYQAYQRTKTTFGGTPIDANTTCPHCQRAITARVRGTWLTDHDEKRWYSFYYSCPSCNGFVVTIVVASMDKEDGDVDVFHAYPRISRPVPPEVPEPYRSEFREASLVLQDSPKASAALSRRCLQLLLRNKLEVKRGKLSEEIEEALKSNKIPSHLADDLHYVREIGNLAAHPHKDEHTGMIVDVEPGEAEYLLEVLEGLFDALFVAPARQAQRRSAIQSKLKQLGRRLPNWMTNKKDAG